MKQLFGNNAYDMLIADKGLIVVLEESDENGRYFCYKFISPSFTGEPMPITKSSFLSAKFRDCYDALSMQIGNHIKTKIVWPSSKAAFVITGDDGKAKLLQRNGCLVWQGSVVYKGEGPADIALLGDTLWASFPSSNALIRFNLRTMREELRIGGPSDKAFSSPHGVFTDKEDNKLYVCSAGSGNITAVDLGSFTVCDYLHFDEPVRKYCRIGTNEYIMLDSGLYAK